MASVSLATQRLLRAMLDSDSDEHYGYGLMQQTGLKSGTLYPILMRLEDAGWVESHWDEHPTAGRPPRRLYRLTQLGATAAVETIQATLTGLQLPRGLRPRFDGGRP
jgi:PadR family transcriptional regulator PadR